MKKTKYTCDKCGEEVIIYGIGYLIDSTFVEISVHKLGEEKSIDVKYHLHYRCFKEMLNWLQQKE